MAAPILELPAEAGPAVADVGDGGPTAGRHVAPTRAADTLLRSVRHLVVVLVRVCGVGIVVLVAVGFALGFRAAAVLSGSMQPTLDVGDLVVSRPAQVHELVAGDVVTFRNRAGRNGTTTHRVVSVTRSGDRIRVVTKGDANRTTERWDAPPNGSVGRQVLHVPFVGRVMVWLGLGWVRAALVTVVVLLGLRWLLLRIWRTDRPTAGHRR